MVGRGGGVVLLGGEGLLPTAPSHGERRALLASDALDARFAARGQEPRIGVDVVDERVHLRRAVLHDGGSGDFLHALEFIMSIVDNRKASHDYFIEERYEAGIALQGWEVKAIRAGRAQIGEA